MYQFYVNFFPWGGGGGADFLILFTSGIIMMILLYEIKKMVCNNADFDSKSKTETSSLSEIHYYAKLFKTLRLNAIIRLNF